MEKFSWTEAPSRTAFPIASAGYPFIGAVAFATAVLALLEVSVAALLGLLATFFVAYFFRDPDRVVPNDSEAVVAPADGKVLSVTSMNPNPYYDSHCQRVSIFMSVFNVHVNRIPYEGRIKKIVYHPGKFIAANRDKASEDNERNALFLETPNGKHITAVQIAGLIARRIICTMQEGQDVRKGQRCGMICFGSRVDIYLPSDATISVAAGETVKGGTSILGRLS